MKDRKTSDDVFINAIARINRYLVMMSIFFLAYFLLKTKIDTFLFFLALSYMAFALLSYKHLLITQRINIELERAKDALDDVARETREIHPDK